MTRNVFTNDQKSRILRAIATGKNLDALKQCLFHWTDCFRRDSDVTARSIVQSLLMDTVVSGGVDTLLEPSFYLLITYHNLLDHEVVRGKVVSIISSGTVPSALGSIVKLVLNLSYMKTNILDDSEFSKAVVYGHFMATKKGTHLQFVSSLEKSGVRVDWLLEGDIKSKDSIIIQNVKKLLSDTIKDGCDSDPLKTVLKINSLQVSDVMTFQNLFALVQDGFSNALEKSNPNHMNTLAMLCPEQYAMVSIGIHFKFTRTAIDDGVLYCLKKMLPERLNWLLSFLATFGIDKSGLVSTGLINKIKQHLRENLTKYISAVYVFGVETLMWYSAFCSTLGLDFRDMVVEFSQSMVIKPADIYKNLTMLSENGSNHQYLWFFEFAKNQLCVDVSSYEEFTVDI
jgi:hypothetical protein